MNSIYSALFFTSLVSVVSSTTVADIQGPAWKSPLTGKSVSNITGTVTAKADDGFYIAGDPSDDVRVSNGLYVFTTSTSVLAEVAVGDSISLSGTVAEYRPSADPSYLTATELDSPSKIVVLSKNNTITPLVLGQDRSPPTELLSALDVGPDGWLSVPNNSSLISVVNATLDPTTYGMDFWESLEGQLVKIPSPVAIDFENSFGEFWVYGDWPVTGKNSRGGLTITDDASGLPDGNPETVIIGSPLDGTSNPSVAVGVTLDDIVGVVYYEFGFFYVLPLTAPTVASRPSAVVPSSNITRSNDACTITFGDYNVENMAPTSANIPAVANHVSSYLNLPDIMFVQEIQDNSGPTDDGVVDGTVTLTTLTDAIANVSGVTYSFTEISPVDGMDGGEPGGNIRVAYLYRADKVTLVNGTAGGATDAVGLTTNGSKPSLTLNPGRIDPSNAAWEDSRKPLVAQWQTASGVDLFTINVHFSSKDGSSSTEGDARPPVNSPIEQRTSQVSVVADFVQTILDADSDANIVMAGDCNEYTQTHSVFASILEVLNNVDDLAGIPSVEQYTYVFDQNMEQLDHIFVSDAIANRGVNAEHVHVNTWATSYDVQTSDHDPSVAEIQIC